MQAYLDMAEQFENQTLAEANSLTAENGEEFPNADKEESVRPDKLDNPDK